MGCQKKDLTRINVNRYKWHALKKFDKRVSLKETLGRAWRFHLASGLHVPDIVFRKIIYDAVRDAIVNSNGRISSSWREFLNEYEKFNLEYQKLLNQHRDKFQEWENYRSSPEYQLFLENLKQIKRADLRVRTNVDNALAYLYVRYYSDLNLYKKFDTIEKALKLDVIEKAWSKKSLWLLATLLVFDANDLYAKTEGNNQVKEIYDPYSQAVKIHVTRWYERTDYFDDSIKTLSKVYENVITTIAGEIGSVLATEVIRRNIIHSLLYTARAISYILPHSRIPLTLANVAQILNQTVLSWLGFQIFVEWQIDGFIQKTLYDFYRYFWYLVTGDSEIIRKYSYSKDDFKRLLELTYKAFTEGFSSLEYEEWKTLFESMPQHLKNVINNMVIKLQNARRVYNLKKALYDSLRKLHHSMDRLFNYINSKWMHQDIVRELSYPFKLDEFYETMSRRYSFDLNAFQSAFNQYSNALKDYVMDYTYGKTDPDTGATHTIIVSSHAKKDWFLEVWNYYFLDFRFDSRTGKLVYPILYKGSSYISPDEEIAGTYIYSFIDKKGNEFRVEISGVMFRQMSAYLNTAIINRRAWSYDKDTGENVWDYFDENLFNLLFSLVLQFDNPIIEVPNALSSANPHHFLLDYFIRLKCFSIRKAKQLKPFYLYISNLTKKIKYTKGSESFMFIPRWFLNYIYSFFHGEKCFTPQVNYFYEVFRDYAIFDDQIWVNYALYKVICRNIDCIRWNWANIFVQRNDCLEHQLIFGRSHRIFFEGVLPPRKKSKRSKVVCIPS